MNNNICLQSRANSETVISKTVSGNRATRKAMKFHFESPATDTMIMRKNMQVTCLLESKRLHWFVIDMLSSNFSTVSWSTIYNAQYHHFQPHKSLLWRPRYAGNRMVQVLCSKLLDNIVFHGETIKDISF